MAVGQRIAQHGDCPGILLPCLQQQVGGFSQAGRVKLAVHPPGQHRHHRIIGQTAARQYPGGGKLCHLVSGGQIRP